MKYLPLLGTMILSASPAIADEFVYLECENKHVAITKYLKPPRITEEAVTSDIQHLKVDLVNSRFMTAENPQWDEAEVVNGAVVIDDQMTANGLTASIKANMQLDPPGRITTNILELNDDYSSSIKITGMCKKVDASVFEKALNQRRNYQSSSVLCSSLPHLPLLMTSFIWNVKLSLLLQ